MTISISNQEVIDSINMAEAISSWSNCDETIKDLSEQMIERIITDIKEEN